MPNREKQYGFSFLQFGLGKDKVNSFMSWVGGKKALRDTIVSRLCNTCDRYVEVFGGGGWVLFHKPPAKFEVYNDFNPNLANLYRCVRDHPEELCEELRYSLNSRTDFELLHRFESDFFGKTMGMEIYYHQCLPSFYLALLVFYTETAAISILFLH